ncbi:hypothetical protein TNCV_232601 [Trichonephila clavipes]|nr:hypothetical protein TNCV_232601 [Trichonephila clavipes]
MVTKLVAKVDKYDSNLTLSPRIPQFPLNLHYNLVLENIFLGGVGYLCSRFSETCCGRGSSHAFERDACFSNWWFVNAVQRVFRHHFDIPPPSQVPDRKYVLMWNDAFRETGNVSKERKGPLKTVRSPET